ncbi:MAG: hypothetical protein ACKKMR_00580 [Candidatus Nealsonbacteria bacterium]
MGKKTIIATILGVALVAVIIGVVLAGYETSCDRYLAGYWAIHNPANRVCSTDYYTFSALSYNCDAGWLPYGWADYASWRFTTNNQWVGDSDSYFYIPWYETNPVTYADYHFYNKDYIPTYCIGKIDHYNTYGWTNAHTCPCVGKYSCYGFASYWSSEKDRLIVTDCGSPADKRIYADASRIYW